MRAAVLGWMLVLWACVPRAETLVLESGPQAVISVELFTSESCSSCPAAERWLSTLADDPGLWRRFAPLAWHVAYWNHLGWKDAFSSSRFSARQDAYRRAGALRRVYTPGVLVGGKEWLDWRRGDPLPSTTSRPGKLRLELGGASARIRFAPQSNAGKGPWRAHLALLGSGFHRRIGTGENRGRTLAEDFVVLGWAQSLRARGGHAPEWTLVVPQAPAGAVRRAAVAWVASDPAPVPIQIVGGWLD